MVKNINCYLCGVEIKDSEFLDSPSFKYCKIPCESCCLKIREEELNKHVKKEMKYSHALKGRVSN